MTTMTRRWHCADCRSAAARRRARARRRAAVERAACYSIAAAVGALLMLDSAPYVR